MDCAGVCDVWRHLLEEEELVSYAVFASGCVMACSVVLSGVEGELASPSVPTEGHRRDIQSVWAPHRAGRAVCSLALRACAQRRPLVADSAHTLRRLAGLLCVSSKE